MGRRAVWATTVAASGLSVLALAAGQSWACVPQPLLSIKPDASGPASSEVLVEGNSVPGAVEVRWNALDGPMLARPTGPNFSSAVTIPRADEGLYAIVVIGRAPDGSVSATGRAAFEVTGAGGSPLARPTPAPKSDPSDDTPALVLLAGVAGVAGGLVSSLLMSRRQRS
ncbi:MAG TPA: hypothetical protein VM142_02340 [Acidimicrobiales bacterium]|nr:hypothetical protein [Acidimicrobiales bacterium]